MVLLLVSCTTQLQYLSDTFNPCTTQLQYLGDTFNPNSNPLDVYYDIGDIKVDYKVIGKLTGTNSGFSTLDEIKNDMIKDARNRGAEGILFLHFENYEDSNSVYANLIVYN